MAIYTSTILTSGQSLGSPSNGAAGRPLRPLLLFLRECFLICLLLTGINAKAYAQNFLAVVNRDGEVWPRELTLTSVGPGFKLAGPSLFGGPYKFVTSDSDSDIVVVTAAGTAWNHTILDSDGGSLDGIQGGIAEKGSLFDGSNAEFVLKDYPNYYVINTAGEVWVHVDQNGTIGPGKKLNGPSLFGGSNQKYVLYDPGFRILVLNSLGQVWAHDLSCAHPGPLGCVTPDSIGSGYKLTGPGLFGAPNDKYALVANQCILIVNTAGQVWAHKFSHSTIQGGFQLQGPVLFGGNNDAFVTALTGHPLQ